MAKRIFLFLTLCILSGTGLPVKAASGGLAAERIAQSQAQILRLKAGQTVNFWVTFKNTGHSSWSANGADKLILRTTSGLASKFRNNDWPSENQPLIQVPNYIHPNEKVTISFNLKAPEQMGLYWEKFNLFAGSHLIPGGEIEIPIKTITGQAPPLPSTNQAYWQTIKPEIKIIENKKMEEPKIRVGLLYVEEEEKPKYLPLAISTVGHKIYDLSDPDGHILVRNTQGEKTYFDFDYKTKRYFINDALNHRLLMTDSFIRFSSPLPKTIFKIDNWQNNNSFWGEKTTDNQFRGKIEVQYNPSTERLWLINELPLEKYLDGVAEVGDSAPQEFLKAQAIASRTYALFRINNPKYTNTPTGKGLFDLRSTQADQVYRGVNQEKRSPHFQQAVKETRGIAMTYKNEPILAYYFAQSDGRTRSSESAGMTRGPVPYLISKIDPPGKGKKLIGHGVGMPQRSGVTAASEGANFSQILKYYYTGIDLTRLY